MSYAWDGTDQSSNATLNGTFAYFLSASNSLSSPPPAPSSGGSDGGDSPPSFGPAISSNSQQLNSASGLDEAVQEEIPWAIYPAGMEPPPPPQTFGMQQPSVHQSLFSTSSVYSDSASTLDAQMADAPLPAPQQPQQTPQPSRPETRTQKGTSGSIGMVALQNYTPASNKPRKIIGTVNIDLNLPAPSLFPWPAIMANNFQLTMKRGNFTSAFNKNDRQITSDQLQGSASNIFNTGVDFGLMMSHGTRGLQQDDLSTSTPSLQTYVPFPPSGGQYSWIPISKMNFGGSQLKWMGLYACNLLYVDNYNDLFNKNLLPLTPNLHMFMTGSTTIWGNGVFGVKLGESLTGKSQTATNAPASVLESWFSASTAAHQAINSASPGLITTNVHMSVIYWPDCVGDTIYQFAASSGGGDDQSTSVNDDRQVYP